MMQERAAARSILLVSILILMLFAAPGCATDVSKDDIDDVPKATIEVEWEKSLTAPDDLGVMSIQQTSDGGYFIVGSTNCGYGTRGSVTSCDILLIKTDANGNVEWESNKSREWWRLDSAFQTADGGYMFAFNDKLIKTDSSGNEEWQKALPRVSWTDSIVRQTSDGGYIALGTEVFWGSHGGADAWLAKVDSSGNPEWEKTLGNGYGRTVQQTFDNGFIILCGRTSISGGWLLKTDWTGQQERDGIFGHGQLMGVTETMNAHFIVLSHDDNGTWLTKLGNAGHYFTPQWDNNYAAPAYPASIQRTPDGGCIVVEHDDSLVWLMKVDSEGQLKWEASLGDFGKVSSTSDGGYIAARHTKDGTTGESPIQLVKLKCTPP